MKEATRAVNGADTLDEVYSAVMEIDPDAFEAKFGCTAPEGLWRAIAGAEVILAHLEATTAPATITPDHSNNNAPQLRRTNKR